MVTEMISMKLDGRFLKEIDSAVDEENYQSRTEFIRSALREKLDKTSFRKIRAEIEKLRGASKKNITDEQLRAARDIAFEKLCNQVK